MNKLTLYHGTDLEVAKKIVKDGFIVKKNKHHWLGNGIYFFLDYNLAKWWTTRPDKEFGTNITKPAIVKCELEISDEKILDLSNLSMYKECVSQFTSFYKIYCMYVDPSVVHEITEVVCTFFDYITSFCGFDVIIGNYFLPSQPYLKNIDTDFFNKSHLCYVETQVAVSEEHSHHLLSNFSIIELEK